MVSIFPVLSFNDALVASDWSNSNLTRCKLLGFDLKHCWRSVEKKTVPSAVCCCLIVGLPGFWNLNSTVPIDVVMVKF